jgi:hypothetical protein
MPWNTPGCLWLSLRQSPVSIRSGRFAAISETDGSRETVEYNLRVAASADGGDDSVGQGALRPILLLPCLYNDQRLKIPDNHRERMRAQNHPNT